MNLTPQEEQLRKCLQTVPQDSIWGVGIHTALKMDDEERFRGLIQQLQSQNVDNPVIMRGILSDACYEALVNYKS
jgi:hypothetical protein